MRKNNFKLIKKTLEWLHRSKGSASVKLPAEMDADKIRYFKISGNSITEDDGTVKNVGDYDEELASYVIRYHIHGRNLMGGEEFMEIHKALNISKTIPSVVEGCYSTSPMPEYNGTVIIGPKHVKFKKKTPYTLAIYVKYYFSALQRSITLRFDYSDGTYDAPIIDSAQRQFSLCFTSDPEKDLVSISSHQDAARNVRIGISQFGLYEGEYTDYDTAHESYYGQRGEILLAEPLRKIAYAADELDIFSGKVTRKIHTVTINADSVISLTETDGVFKIPLALPMRPGGIIASAFEALTDDCEAGLCATDDGSALLFKASGTITTEEDIISYLNENPFEIAYILQNPIVENITVSIPTLENEATFEVLCETEPSKIVAEYV